MVGTDLIDRADELANIDALLDGLSGGLAVLELAGGPGIGKTSLWAQARRRAEALGCTVLWARPTEASANSAFGAIADLLFPVDPGLLEKLPEPQREALEVALLRRSAPHQQAPSRAVAAGLLGLVRVLADAAPLLIAIDDWIWLDRPSRDALEFTVRRLEHERVGIVYALRTPAATTGLTGLIPDERLTRLQLKGLQVHSIASLISDRLGVSLSRPLLVRISDATAGNPFHALELARALVELESELPPGSSLPVPENLRELILARIGRLPKASREALSLVAVLARPTAAAVGQTAIARAEDADVVTVEPGGHVRFNHPLLATAVLSGLSPAQLRSVHARAAYLATEPEQRARHLALAAAGPDAGVAADLDESAHQAQLRGAPVAAAELAELAAALTPPAAIDERVARTVHAAELLLSAGDVARAERLLSQSRDTEASDPVRARALQVSGQLAGRRHNWPAAVDRGLAALALAAGHPALKARIECDLAFACVSVGDFQAALVHAQAAAEHAAQEAQAGVEAAALAVLTMVRFLVGMGVDPEPLRRSLELEDRASLDAVMMRPTFISALLDLYRGQAASAADSLARLCAQMVEHGLEGAAPIASVFVVWAHLWHGDFAAATRVAAAATAAATLLDDPGNAAGALTANALVHAHTGQLELARTEAESAITQFMQLQWGSAVIWPSWALGLAALASGDVELVDATLHAPAEQLAAMGAGDPIVGLFVPDEVHALAALGREQEAERLLDWFQARSEALSADWAIALAARCRGELAMRAGDLEAASAAFTAALAAHERCPIPFERARTLLTAGSCLRRAKQRGAAVEMLREAETAFATLGASGWAERACHELGRVGRRNADPDLLSVGERRIAELAAAGLSNREIADRAFVSVKTVEANLTRVYRKLGVRSRVGLARALKA